MLQQTRACDASGDFPASTTRPAPIDPTPNSRCGRSDAPIPPCSGAPIGAYRQFDRSLIIIYARKLIYSYMTKNAMSEPETTRLTITWSKEADHALRSFLGAQGMKKGDLSKFIEEAVRWRIFHQTVREAREAFADVSPDKLQKMIDEVVEDVRAKHYRERAKRS